MSQFSPGRPAFLAGPEQAEMEPAVAEAPAKGRRTRRELSEIEQIAKIIKDLGKRETEERTRILDYVNRYFSKATA